MSMAVQVLSGLSSLSPRMINLEDSSLPLLLETFHKEMDKAMEVG